MVCIRFKVSLSQWACVLPFTLVLNRVFFEVLYFCRQPTAKKLYAWEGDYNNDNNNLVFYAQSTIAVISGRKEGD